MSATKCIPSPAESRSGSALPRAYRLAILALLVLLASEIVLSSRQQSQASDEADHLYAGYQYWKHADFGRNPEHPPLAKLIAASALLPLHLAEPDDPNTAFFKSRDFLSGEKFLYAADAGKLLARGRGMLLIFPVALALAIFAAAREMFSPEAGLLSMALFCLEPILLANSSLILTDMAISCMFFVSVYSFYRYIKQPTVARLLLCSAAVGLTLAAKQSGALIFPILAALALANTLLDRRQSSDRVISLSRKTASLTLAFAAIAIASYAILWAFYAFRYAARPHGLPMSPTLNAYIASIPSAFERSTLAFCASHHLLPEAYLYGWSDILQVPGTRDSFVLGHLHPGSWLLGFPSILVIKTTLTLLVLLALVPIAKIHRHRREFLFLAIPAVFYLLIAILSGMNAEARYVLPIYPFSIVLAGAAAWQMARRSRRWAIAIAALFAFAAASSLHAFPYLAYANEAFGGPSQSYRIIAGTNADGGQSLKSVKSYLDTNHISDCWFDYVNPYVDPHYYGIPCKPLVSESVLLGAPLLGQVPPTITGTVLISATEAAGRTWEPDSLNPYAPFTHLQSNATPGNIVLVYRGTFDVHLLSAYSHSITAKALLTNGRTAEAISEAQLAASLAPDSASIQANLGLTLMQAGRKQEGQQVNATALRLARSNHPELQQPLIQLLQTPGIGAPPQ